MNEEYIKSLYDWIVSQDNEFSNVSLQDFSEGLKNETYVKEIHNYLLQKDNSFASLDEFSAGLKSTQQPMAQEQQPVKKKEAFGDYGVLGYQQTEGPIQRSIKEGKPTESLSEEFSSGSQLADAYGLPVKGLEKITQTQQDVAQIEKPKSPFDLQLKQEVYAKKQEEIQKEQLRVLRETNALKQKEQEIQKEIQLEANLRSETPDFINKLSTVNTSIFDDYSNIDAIKKEFAPYGIVVEKTGFFGNKLTARSLNGEVSVEIDLSVDSNTEKAAELERLRSFIKQNNRVSEEEDFLNKALRAKNMRPSARTNDDGTQSTVKFVSFDNKVIPTLFPKVPNPKTKDDWMELPFEQALEEAKKRGEVFTFKTDKEAKDFAAGSWKEISKVDIEGDKFFKQRGRDYMSDAKKLDRYKELESIINFVEGYNLKSRTSDGYKGSALTELAKEQYPNLFIGGNKLRGDINEVVAQYKKERDLLKSQVKDMTFMKQDGTLEKTVMDFDAHLANLQREASMESAKLFREAKTDIDIIDAESLKRFNMPIETLMKENVNNIQDKQAYNNLVQKYSEAQKIAKTAAMKYDESQTYFDAKTNKEITSELSDNWNAISSSLSDGLKNGFIGDQLLALSMPGYVSWSGVKDKESAAKYISSTLAGMSGTQSRTMTRLAAATSAMDWIDVILDDPFEATTIAVGQSLSQMLPYGIKIVPAITAPSTGIGSVTGLLGGPFAPFTVTTGATAGFFTGLKMGQAVTGFATEYTNAVMEAVENNGYKALDPESLEQALNDQRVWDEARAVGLARGVPIAVVDYVTAGLAGKMIKPASKLATTSSKLSRAAAENVIIDPLAESGGELVAQGSEIVFGTGRKEIDFNEVALEGLGSIGTNVPNYVLNTYSAIKKNTDIDLAYSLTDYKNIASENVSDERISSWANNMQRLGKIDESVNQKIQENVGLRRDAKGLMSVGGKKVNDNVTARTMELLAAKKELTSSKERQEIYGEDIRAINEELSAMGKSKELLPAENQVDLSSISGIETKEVGEYMINGRRYTKQQFLDKINSSTPERLAKLNIGVKNDEEVSQTLNDKLDAFQKQTTGEVSVQPEAGIGQEMVEGEPETGLEAAPKQGLSPEESQRKEELLAAFENPSELESFTEGEPKPLIKVNDAYEDKADAQAELDALLQKEQATPEGLGAQLEIAEKEAAPVQPVETFTEQDKARQQELTDALAKADKRRKNITVGETVMPKADVKAELDALNQKELSSQQPVTEPVTETLTPEQEADKLEQMMLAKMGAPKVEAAPVTETPVTETVPITEVAPEATEEVKGSPWDIVNAEEKAYREKQQKDKDQATSDIELINNGDQKTIDKYFKKSGYVEITGNETNPNLKGRKGVYKQTGASLIIKGSKQKAALDTATNISKKKIQGLPSARVEQIVREFEKKSKQPKTEAPVTEGKVETENEKTAKRIRGKKMKGTLSTLDFGITQTVYNGALEFMARQVESGTKIGEAITATINWIDTKVGNIKWDKESFSKYMNTAAEQKKDIPELKDVNSTTKLLKKNNTILSALRDAIANINRSYVLINGIKYTKDEIKDLIYDIIGSEVDKIVDIKITGSRVYGTSKNNSDLDIIVEYEGDIREDTLFDIANGERLKIGNVRIDINPIKAEKSGTISENAIKERKYLDEVADEKYLARAYHSAKVDGTNPKLVEAVEGLLQPAKEKTPSLSDAVRSLKIKGPGGLQSNILGVPIAIWNAAVLTTANAIDAGVAVSKAVKKGVKKVKDLVKKNKLSSKITDKEIDDVILKNIFEVIRKKAKDSGFSDTGVRIYLKRNGIDDATIDMLFGAPEEASTSKLNETILPGYNEMMNKVDAMIARQIKRGTAVDKIGKNLDALLRKFDAYINATDAQKKALEQEARNRIGAAQKRAPSTGRILGAFKDITNLGRKEKSTILNNIMRLSKDAANDLANEIKAMKVNGKITISQFTAIQKRLSKVNFSNESSISSFVDYMAKVFKDAEYAEKKARANDLRSKIKQLSKNKGKFGNLTTFAAEFAKIDPAMVENIDEYIEMASNVKEGVQGSKIVRGNVIPADMVDVGKTMEYVNKMMEAQDKLVRQKAIESLQNLMDVDVSDLTYDKIVELIDLVRQEENTSGEQKEEISKKIEEFFKLNKDREKAVRDAINKMFDSYAAVIKNMFETGIDPFSDPDNPTTVEFKESDKKIVEEFMDMDLKQLDAKEALRAADALNNFIVNKSIAGMEGVLGTYRGRKNVKEVDNKGIRSKEIKMYFSPAIGRLFFEQFASVPLFFERLFKGFKAGQYVREKMGINSLINHKAEALDTANRIINKYVLQFSKMKPNNKSFQDMYNIIERGIIGDLAKTIIGDDKQVAAEFNRRKKLIEESIEVLNKGGTKKETEAAKIIKEVYDKIARDANDIAEVKANADQINVDAVQFWVDEWAKLYDQFADVALSVYNKVLDKNVNYVPDRFGFLERADKVKKDTDGTESLFFSNSNTENFYKKEAGSLMKSTPPTTLFDSSGKANMYVNLSFDTNNANALLEALIDIKTAADIRQIQAFTKSPEFENIIPSGKDASLAKDRIATLIRNIRNKRIVTDKVFRDVTRKLDRIASLGTALALAGPTQAISQTVPVAVNTLTNSVGNLKLSNLHNKAVNDFINNSGMAIANRGVEATTELETLNQKLEAVATAKTEKVARFIENINRKYLKIYLSNFDVMIARASWIAYYEQYLKKQKEYPKQGIDYSNHEMNKEAAQYAQDMVDRQQNISDKDLAGKMYQSDNPLKQFITKIAMPLSTFRMNQTTRFSNDLAVLSSKTASNEDKRIAARSLGGFAAEMATFRLVKLYIGYYVFYSIAQFIRGEEDDEEEKKKKWDNMVKGAATSVTTDVLSPAPFADIVARSGFSAVLDKVQEFIGTEEEDRYNIFTDQGKTVFESFISDLGILGIAADKATKLYENIRLGITGEFTDNYNNKKTIMEKDRELLSNPLYIALGITTTLGINPFSPETNNVMNTIVKSAKKDAMTGEQLKEYQETGRTKSEAKKYKAERKAMKEEAYGGYETLEEFEKNDPEKFDEYSARGGKLYKYRESERLEEEEKNKDKPFRGLSEKKFKELYPREWRENYGPGTEYFREQNTPEKRRERAMEKREEAKREMLRKRREVQEKIRERQERYGR